MKNKKKEEESRALQERSFTVALEQVAQLLRTEIKLKDRQTKIIPSSSLPSLHNFIEQVALMLRTQVQSKKHYGRSLLNMEKLRINKEKPKKK